MGQTEFSKFCNFDAVPFLTLGTVDFDPWKQQSSGLNWRGPALWETLRVVPARQVMAET